MQEVKLKNFFTTMTIVYFAPAVAMLLFSGVVYFLHQQGQVEGSDMDADIFRYMLYVLTPAAVIAGHFVFRHLVSNVSATLSLREKLGKYQAGFLVRGAFIEAPGLLGVVAAMLTQDMMFLVFPVVLLGVFLYWRPQPESIAEDLQLSQEESIILNDPEGILK